MQIGEARISALAVSALTGAGLTLMLTQALKDLGAALAISLPVAGIMAVILFLFASDDVKNKGGDAPPPKQTTKGE